MFWAILESFSDIYSPCQLSGRLPSLVVLRRENTRHCQPTWHSTDLYFLRPNSIFWHRQCPKVKVYSWQWQCTKVKVWVLSQSTLIKCFMICTEMRSLNTTMKSDKQISSPALSVNPACGSVGAKNVAFCVLSKKILFFSFLLYNTATNLYYEYGGPVVADPWGHLCQAFAVGDGRVQETPVLSVLKQKVGVDEQGAGELKSLINLEII